MNYSKHSVVVIGSGISGLYASLKLDEQAKLPNGILLITKSELGESNSKYAQGGMVAVMKENKSDSTESHIKDTIIAGAGLSEFNTVKFISENSDKIVHDLLKFGVKFDRDENNNLCFTKEAAHSVRRILHSGGDATGKLIEKSLRETVKSNQNIKIYENTIVVKLLVDENSVCNGVVVFNPIKNEYETISTNTVILATGGIGQLYKYTTNPIGATGDGLALAYDCGTILQDMEFVQFHPTALAIDDEENRFLISEAVRGEGAKLVDADGVEFMQKYDERKELAPRDIVTRANYNEMINNHSNCVYLNATCINKEKLAKRFPTISKKCLNQGIDISKDFIPVAPAAHYFMGGIKTDTAGRTSIDGLYAIGEVASTGLHGANRLASNSLLECVVLAYTVAEYLKSKDLKAPSSIDEEFEPIINKYSKKINLEKIDTKDLKKRLQNIMWDYVGIIRDEASLLTAKNKLDELLSEFNRDDICLTKEEYELKNMLKVAKLIIMSALNRKESRGAHYRKDYPQTNPEGLHTCLSNKKGEFNFVE